MRLFPQASAFGFALFVYAGLTILIGMLPVLVGLGVALAEGTIWPDAVFAGVGVMDVVAWAYVKYRGAVDSTVTGRGKTTKDSDQQQ